MPTADLVPSLGKAPAGFRNWLAASHAVVKREIVRQEFSLYSDAQFVFEELAVGPYSFMNTMAGGGRDPRAGVLSRALVLRVDHHLEAGEMLLDPVKPATQTTAFHGGWIDEELAALLSLSLGVRCRSGGMTRYWRTGGDVLGRPAEFTHRPPYAPAPEFDHAPVIPGVARRVDLRHARELLLAYPRVPDQVAGRLVRAARLYQAALWGAEGDPSLAWLQLVSALEAALPKTDPSRANPMESLVENWSELAEILDRAPLDVRDDAARLLADQVKIQHRLRRLLEKFPPSAPAQRPEVGRIDWSNIADLTVKVYRHRSNALHAGVPMPAPMCNAPMHYNEIAFENGGSSGHGAGDSTWKGSDIPMLLHTFVHIVGDVLRQWWAAEASDLEAAG